MKKIARAVIAATGVMAATGALAADVSPVIPAPVVVAAPPAPAGFDWSRAYIGGSLGSWREDNFGPHNGILSRAVVQAGFNFQVGGRFLVGVEGQVGLNDFLGGGAELEYAILGRAGLLAGQRVLVYGAAGYSNGPNNDPGTLLGGGVELGIGSRMSIRAETLIYRDFGNADFIDHFLIGGGVNFFFGG